jgi:hypothetical protein
METRAANESQDVLLRDSRVSAEEKRVKLSECLKRGDVYIYTQMSWICIGSISQGKGDRLWNAHFTIETNHCTGIKV